MEDKDKLNKSLTENTINVFEEVSKLECIKDLYMCGGTAQALQMQHRKSEDLDFELISTKKNNGSLDLGRIISEVKSKFPKAKTEILGENHLQMFIGDNVKLSFFKPQNPVPYINVGYQYNNIKAPNLQDLLGMKVFTTSVRLKYRDYYDIFSLVLEDYNLSEAVRYACKFSRHEIKSKEFYTNLTTSSLYEPDVNFKLLDAKHQVDPIQIQEVIKQKIIKEKMQETTQEKPKKNKIKQFKI